MGGERWVSKVIAPALNPSVSPRLLSGKQAEAALDEFPPPTAISS